MLRHSHLSAVASSFAIVAAALLCEGQVAAHGGVFPPKTPGGTYSGPGDTIHRPPRPKSGAPPPGQPTAPPKGPHSPTGAAGRPAAPGPNSLPGGGSAEATVWQLWWRFNRHPYLDLKAYVHAGAPRTGDDDFFLGRGSKQGAGLVLRPRPELIASDVVPVLEEVLRTERSNDLLTASLIALAKIGAAEDAASARVRSFEPFLAHSSQEVAETAALALGILGSSAGVPALTDLALDTERGRKLVRSTSVSDRTRAFATFGLGLVAARSSDNGLRQGIADTLITILETGSFATREVETAAITSLGLAAVAVRPEIPARDSGQARGPYTLHVVSRRAQVAYLLKRFEKKRANGLPYLVRAHVPTALARLAVDAPGELEERVIRALLEAVKQHTKETSEVQQSAVLALGILGDADLDELDVKIRAELVRLLAEGTPQVRRFALIALAQVGSRPGLGDASIAGTVEVRKVLLSTLARGKSQLKAWAGLALGVLGRGQLAYGEAPDASVTSSLRAAAKDCNRPQDIGAYALGLGLCSDPASERVMLERLDAFAADAPRAELAVALGLLGERGSIEPLRLLMDSTDYRPELIAEVATGLALLGDKSVVPSLVDRLAEARSLSSQASIARALGAIGDARSIEPLVTLLQKQDLTDSARAFAAVALGTICDKEALPWSAKISTAINYRATTATLLGEARGVLEIL